AARRARARAGAVDPLGRAGRGSRGGGRAPRPAHAGARPGPRAGPALGDRADDRLERRQQPARQPRRAGTPAATSPVMALRAVLFDVDFTLAKPGPDLGPEGYQRLGRRFGLELDPARYGEARTHAVSTLERHPELDHDEQVWVL